MFCAASTSVLMLSFARVLQGLGGGGLMTLSQALIAEAVPPRQRGRYQGYLSGMYAAAATFGPGGRRLADRSITAGRRCSW